MQRFDKLRDEIEGSEAAHWGICSDYDSLKKHRSGDFGQLFTHRRTDLVVENAQHLKALFNVLMRVATQHDAPLDQAFSVPSDESDTEQLHKVLAAVHSLTTHTVRFSNGLVESHPLVAMPSVSESGLGSADAGDDARPMYWCGAASAMRYKNVWVTDFQLQEPGCSPRRVNLSVLIAERHRWVMAALEDWNFPQDFQAALLKKVDECAFRRLPLRATRVQLLANTDPTSFDERDYVALSPIAPMRFSELIHGALNRFRDKPLDPLDHLLRLGDASSIRAYLCNNVKKPGSEEDQSQPNGSQIDLKALVESFAALSELLTAVRDQLEQPMSRFHLEQSLVDGQFGAWLVDDRLETPSRKRLLRFIESSFQGDDQLYTQQIRPLLSVAEVDKKGQQSGLGRAERYADRFYVRKKTLLLGGTKPQNISDLSSGFSGNHPVLVAAVPQIQSISGIREAVEKALPLVRLGRSNPASELLDSGIRYENQKASFQRRCVQFLEEALRFVTHYADHIQRDYDQLIDRARAEGQDLGAVDTLLPLPHARGYYADHHRLARALLGQGRLDEDQIERFSGWISDVVFKEKAKNRPVNPDETRILKEAAQRMLRDWRNPIRKVYLDE